MALGYIALRDDHTRIKKELILVRENEKKINKNMKNYKKKTDKLITDIKIELDIINNLIKQYQKELEVD